MCGAQASLFSVNLYVCKVTSHTVLQTRVRARAHTPQHQPTLTHPTPVPPVCAYLQGAVVVLELLVAADHTVDEGQVHVQAVSSGLLGISDLLVLSCRLGLREGGDAAEQSRRRGSRAGRKV